MTNTNAHINTIVGISLLLILYFIFLFLFPGEFTNTVFVDGVTWLQFIQSILSGDVDIYEIRSSHGMILFYAVVYYLGGVFSIFLINVLIIEYSITKYMPSLLILFLILPFYLINSFLPSKDILVLFLLIFYSSFVIKRQYLFAIMIALLSFAIRDAFGILLIALTFIFYFRLNTRIILLCILVSAAFSGFILEFLYQKTHLFVFERTLGFFHDGDLYQNYFIRLFANATNLISRVEFWSDSNSFSMTGLALYLSGGLVFISLLISVLAILNFKSKKLYPGKLKIVSFICLSAWFVFSISPLIQPRYLIPFSFLVIVFFMQSQKQNKKLIYLYLLTTFIFSIVLRLVYLIFNIPVAALENFDYLII
jgi:hypothetical protein